MWRIKVDLYSRPRHDVRDAIQRLALANGRRGFRLIAFQLRQEGLIVNHKRVLRLMRQDSLASGVRLSRRHPRCLQPPGIGWAAATQHHARAELNPGRAPSAILRAANEQIDRSDV